MRQASPDPDWLRRLETLGAWPARHADIQIRTADGWKALAQPGAQAASRRAASDSAANQREA